jgi:hypothetical protein
MALKPKTVESGEKLKDSAVRIKDSAAGMERSTARVEDSADRRTELAADRTIFAAERTYAAWARTGLVAMASGIGAKALMSDAVQRVLFWHGGVASSLSRAAAPSTRCGTHSSSTADFDECIFVGRFDCGANRHLVRTDARLNSAFGALSHFCTWKLRLIALGEGRRCQHAWASSPVTFHC